MPGIKSEREGYSAYVERFEPYDAIEQFEAFLERIRSDIPVACDRIQPTRYYLDGDYFMVVSPFGPELALPRLHEHAMHYIALAIREFNNSYLPEEHVWLSKDSAVVH